MNNSPLSKEQFCAVYDSLRVNPRLDREFVYQAYLLAVDGASQLINSNVLGRVVPLNPIVLILYIVNDYGFYADSHNLDPKKMMDDEEAIQKIISISLDKYFTNEHLSFQNNMRLSKYSPQISTLALSLNFVLGILSRYKKRDPKSTLLTDILSKGFLMAKAISELIVDGFETEAFSTWRTLHETECILILLMNNKETTIKSYLRHMDYSLAYRGLYGSKEETDKIFEEIKSEMKKLDLKSKDMKKFIEYGWLTSIEGATEVEGFKFNFRDGVEKLANLSNYSKTYEMASEIAHSSPILIYSRNDYFLHLTLLNLYASFFRLEEIFAKIYLSNISKEEAKRYLLLRKTYYPLIQIMAEREQSFFKK